MKKICISKNWKFAEHINYVTGKYTEVDLPHDYQISQERISDGTGDWCNGFYPVTGGRYVKHIEFKENRRYILDIDGAYMCAEIWLNDALLDMHPYGFTPYLVDLTDYIARGVTNKLAIVTCPMNYTSRWYTGNGIYRDVFLWEGSDIGIDPRDMFISTVDADEKEAKIRLKYTVSSARAADITLSFSIIDKDGKLVKTHKAEIKVAENAKTDAEEYLTIESPLLWDTHTPNLYTCVTQIFENGEIVDESENTFGIRTVCVNAKDGLLLNSRSIKLRGGCIHHDHGVLGAAAFPAAEERKIRLLKDAGFNAVRTAHNPPSLALLEVCDRLGMIVMDEAFDHWNKGKSALDYHIFFKDWCLRDISYMVLRDRNHPCVFSYSIGNEIHEVDGTSDAGKWSALLANEVRKYDDTRLVTSGLQKNFAIATTEEIDPEDYVNYIVNEKNGGLTRRDPFEKGREHNVDVINKKTAEYEAPLDIVGYNYHWDRYEIEHDRHPDRIIWGSETRVIYFYDSWKKTAENNYILGNFTWTAFDNIGEAGAGQYAWARDRFVTGIEYTSYPWRCCYQGDFDICGFRRPQSYFREAVWLGGIEPKIFTTHPEHYGEGFSGTLWHWYDVDESWTFEDKYLGKPVKVETYTDADSVLWLLNGREVGESVTEKGIATIDIPYERGTLTAIARKGGKEVSRSTLSTTGAPAQINITPEKTQLIADNRDLCYFDIRITDTEKNLIPAGSYELTCDVKGGELLGFLSPDPCNEDKYTSNICHTYKGLALAVVRARTPGKVSVIVYGGGLASGNAVVEAE